MAFPTTPTDGQRSQEGGLWFTWKECAGGIGAWERDRNQLSFYDPIPIGALMAFGTGQNPNGWLLCDGSTYQAAAYPELFSVIAGSILPAPTTFNVPDLRGDFLRARAAGVADTQLLSHVDWSTGRPQTTPFVTDDLAAQKHTYDIGNGVSTYTSSGNVKSVPDGDNNWKPDIDRQVDRLGLHDHPAHHHTINAGGDTETAPDHTLVDYYIKASHAKVALPASGFLANVNGNLHDGDVWIFDAVSNEFKNVPSSTLSSGMTVGGTAPTAPFEGQLWYETAGKLPGLRVYANGQWEASSGADTFTAGAGIQIPGYFGEDPSDTATPQDAISLAARYYSGAVQLWSNKGGVWNSITPWNGNTASAGKACIADAHGNPTWGQVLPSQVYYEWASSAKHASLYVHNGAAMTKWARYQGHLVTDTISNLWLGLHVNGGTDDAVNKVSMSTGKIVQSGGIWDYGSSGINSGSGINSWTNEMITPGALNADYRCGANTPIGINLYADLDANHGNQLYIRLHCVYTSSNGTPMVANVWWKLATVTQVNRITIGTSAGVLAGSIHGEFI